MKTRRLFMKGSALVLAFVVLGGTVAFAASLSVTPEKLTVFQTATSVPCVAQVSMTQSDTFVPANATITAGCSVTWTNTSSAGPPAKKHTTTSVPAGLWDSGNLDPGETFTRVFGSTGTFNYRCKIHAGMTGTITVN